MRGWAGKGLGGEAGGRRKSGGSEVEVVGQGLVEVEVEVRDGVGLGGILTPRKVRWPGILKQESMDSAGWIR